MGFAIDRPGLPLPGGLLVDLSVLGGLFFLQASCVKLYGSARCWMLDVGGEAAAQRTVCLCVTHGNGPAAI